MTFSRLCLCAVVWMTLTIHVMQATSLENDISTKLAELTEQMMKMSGQLSKLSDHQNKLSEQQLEQTGQLSKLSEQQSQLSEQQSQLSEQQSQLSEQQSQLAEQQSQLSEQHLGQSGQLDKLSNHLDEVTNKLTELTDQHDAAVSRVHELEANIQGDEAELDVISQIKEMQQQLDVSSSGPVFVRWGRKTCNGTSSNIVYTGVAGGTPSNYIGGGADVLCLPRDPSYANHDNFNNWNSSNIMVAEYKLDFGSNFPFDKTDPFLRDHDVPCAVCEITNGSSVMMIPARVDCYSGWRLEYRGYLMTEAYNTTRSQFVCVDDPPEVDYSGSDPAGESLGLYVAETLCIGLSCPPFEAGGEVACVVCSK